MEKQTPLYGLVLAGGKSLRMGRDKGTLEYHGLPQREYLYQLLQKHCRETYLSLRSDQMEDMPEGIRTLADRDEYRGPFNGLLTAHQTYPKVAWLVMACDLPLIDAKTLRLLIGARQTEETATALATRKTRLPEPLAAIWEPSGLSEAMEYLKTAESSCPRKYLLNSETALVFPEDDRVLANANDPDTYTSILSELSSS